MSIIKREHILECCLADQRGEHDCFPEGMNETSAMMTMQLIRSLKAGRMNNRTASSLTYDVILSFFKEHYGEAVLAGAVEALDEYFRTAWNSYGLPMAAHRQVVDSYKK